MKGTNGRSGRGDARANRLRLAAVTAMMLAFSLMATASPAGAGDEDRPEPKVTICHAAGLEGTTHYNTLTIGHSAVYGQAGHFYENGTPQAGHEQDYLGECREDVVNEATLTIVKHVRSTDQEVPRSSFPFVIAAGGETESFALADGGSKSFEFDFDSDRFDVVVGELTGELEEGFSFVSASCASGDRVIAQEGSRASVSLPDGADVTCTFINRYDKAPEDTPSLTVKKEVEGDSGAKTTSFDILVGTRERNVTMSFEDGSSHVFSPLAGTVNFGIAEQPIEEDGWSTAISCVSDERKEPFGSRGPSLVIEEIGAGEDIVCTVINTYDDGDSGSPSNPPTNATTPPRIETPCFDGEALNEAGECVKPEITSAEADTEVVVLGIQIEATTTTVDAVTVDTLPFTGNDSYSSAMAGLFVLVLGVLLLGASFLDPSAVGTGRHQTSARSIRRWTNN